MSTHECVIVENLLAMPIFISIAVHFYNTFS